MQGEGFGDRVLVVDFGSQTHQLIARRVREHGVYCEIHPFDLDEETVREFAPKGIILSGGPETVTEQLTPRIPQTLFDARVPILGICYGMQAMATQLGGEVTGSDRREFGHATARIVGDTPLFRGLGDALDVWMSHGDKVTELPAGFERAAESGNAPIAAMGGRAAQPLRGAVPSGGHPYPSRRRDHPPFRGRRGRVSGRMDRREHNRACRRASPGGSGQGQGHLGLSGGVDSSVVAALLSRAIGDQLTCVFVDNGLLRKNETAEVEAAFSSAGSERSNVLPINLVTVDARDEFLDALVGVDDPEDKRKIIGRTFIEVFEREAAKVPGVAWLAQGTIYPDVIESAASKHGKAHVIKSHHNVGGLPDRMGLKLVEPLRDLFKDEVRAVGLALGLPDRLVYRHPFPGPGLGVRVLGEVKREYLDVLREADAIYIEELREAGYYDKVAQAFAVYLPVKSVGVVGDARRHEHVIGLRAVRHDGFHDRELG